MTSRRRPAFDPSRLDDIDDLLPPTPPIPSPPLARDSDPLVTLGVDEESAVSAASELPGGGVGPPEDETSGGRVNRGQGGRSARAVGSGSVEVPGPSPRVQVPVRVSHALYQQVNNELLAGAERPSYGQLVLWACEDQPDDVAARVRRARPEAGSRRPRGRRLAVDTVQVTLRMTAAERDRIDEIADRVRETHPGIVTRTEIAAAALRSALSQLSSR